MISLALQYAKHRALTILGAQTVYERGFYEGGKKTKANSDFWNANSDFETTASPDRDTLRARARWLSANNAIMDNIDNAILNNVVGTGIRLQSNVDGKKKFNDEVEERWKNWSKKSNCDLTKRLSFQDMQRVILRTRMVDGEIFIYKIITKEGLKLQLIESDNLDASRPDGGVELGSFGEVINYHFKDKDNNTQTIPAVSMINYYMTDRASQYRGVSEYKQSILDIKNFSAFQSAVIMAQRARANIAYTVKQGGNPSNFGGETASKIHNINGVSVYYMNKGEEIGKLDPDGSPTDYTQFSEITIRSIATARKVSYELAFRDYSKVNFASSRASLLQDHKRFDHEQLHMVENILDEIYTEWLTIEVMSGRIKANGFIKDPVKWNRPKWVFPKRDMVDPLKEVTAIEKEIKLNLTTETDVASARGQDYEEILTKKAEEMKLKEKLGVPDLTLLPFADEESGVSDSGNPSDFDENPTGDESKKKDKK